MSLKKHVTIEYSFKKMQKFRLRVWLLYVHLTKTNQLLSYIFEKKNSRKYVFTISLSKLGKFYYVLFNLTCKMLFLKLLLFVKTKL